MSVKIYMVGGAVRDSIMGLPTSKDMDYAVEAGSYAEMRDHILVSGGTIWQEREQYLTIRAKMPQLGDADFVLCRKDGFYSDGRRPDYVEIGTIYDDLARRDFTMNAIAKDVEANTIIDPFHGQEDILHRRIVCVGIPKDRFEEDPLRMLRAIRFSITKGFVIVVTTECCLNDSELTRKLVETVSIDRVRDELTRCFKASTYRTFLALKKYDELAHALFNRYPTLWLKPTTEV